jgi:hypothetical protein
MICRGSFDDNNNDAPTLGTKTEAFGSGRMMWRPVVMNRQLGLPMTFALALAVADPSAKQLLDAGASELLQRGTLKELLSRGHDGPATAPVEGVASDRLAQQSCSNPVWRRC